ncbi:MAG: hypothetical protein QXL88_00800 [Candidatus Pacearchaeota archaeon]
MLSKRGQVTLFIIIAIALILSLSLFWFFQRRSVQQERVEVAKTVKGYVESCGKDRLEKIIEIIALQGGNFEKPKRFIEHSFLDSYNISVPLYIENSSLNVPSKEEIENQISIGLKKEMERCLNFSILPYDIWFDKENAFINSKIKKDLISSTIIIPTLIRLEKDTIVLNEFKIEVPSRLLDLYSASIEITKDQINHPSSLCLECSLEISEKYNLQIYNIEISEFPHILFLYYLIPKDHNKDPAKIYLFAHKFSELS